MGVVLLFWQVLSVGFLAGILCTLGVLIPKMLVILPPVAVLLQFVRNYILFVRLSPKRLCLVGAFLSLCPPMRVGYSYYFFSVPAQWAFFFTEMGIGMCVDMYVDMFVDRWCRCVYKQG